MFLLHFLAAALSYSAYCLENKTSLKLGLFIPGDIGGFAESKSFIPMGKVAQWQINNSTTFLKDYTLETDWFNTKADSGKAIHELFTFIGRKDARDYIGIVGPIFTDVTKYISELAPFFNYVSISPTASSSSLSERSSDTHEDSKYIYRNSLRLHPVETDMYQAILKLTANCSWKKIHILTGERLGEDSEFRSSVMKMFTEKMTDNVGLNVYQYSFTSSNIETIKSAFDELKKDNARILIANFDEDDAYDVFCVGKEKGFLSESLEYSGKRVWVLPSSYKNNWIPSGVAKKKNSYLSCTKNDIIETVGTYLTPQFQWNTTEQTLDTGYNFTETWEMYATEFYNKYSDTCRCPIEEKAGSLMYDSVWTFAIGLNDFLYHFNRSTKLIDNNINNKKDERDILLNQLLERTGNRSADLVKAMKAVSFDGASGRIEFRNELDTTCRSGFKAKIQQLRIKHNGNKSEDLDFELINICEAENELICSVDAMWGSSIYKSKLIPQCENSSDLQCRCPADSPIREKMDQVIIGIPKTSLIFFTVFSITGILLSTTFFVFNVVFMKERVIKMSSPHINNIILIGSILLYSYIPLDGLMTGIDGYSIQKETHLIKMCSVKLLTWILCLGFTISFGALFAKTWRVYAIFTSKKPRNMILSDWKLMILILILLLVDIIILGANEYINRYKWAFDSSNSIKETSDNLLDDIPNVYGELICRIDLDKTGRPELPWLVTAAFVYKGLLLLFGAFIAFQTRKITIPALNDSKYIGIAVYTIFVVASMLGPVTMFLKSQPALKFAIKSAGIIFTNTIMICLVFLPKAYQLRYQPKEAIKNHTVRDREWDSIALSRRESEIQVKPECQRNSKSSIAQAFREQRLSTTQSPNGRVSHATPITTNNRMGCITEASFSNEKLKDNCLFETGQCRESCVTNL